MPGDTLNATLPAEAPYDEMSVAVQVKPAEEPDSEEALRLIATLNRPSEAEQSSQQQQQQ